MEILNRLDVNGVAVKRTDQFGEINGLIIPGGESSVIDKLSRLFGLTEPLKSAIRTGLPVYGTCAGLIMLADSIVDAIEGQQTLGGFDLVVRRNAFGSQVDSFETELEVAALGKPPVRAVFIRAPVVESIGPDVQILASLGDGRVVAVEQDNLLGTSFHPEITGETRFHEYFLAKVTTA